MMFGNVNGCSTMMRGPLGLIISEDCASRSELLEARMDELGMIVGQTGLLLNTIQWNAKDAGVRGRAEALQRALWDVWGKFDPIRYPDQQLEPVAKWIHQDAMDHICAAITMAWNLAEESYMTDDSREIAVEYGDLIRLLRELRDKYVEGKLPEEKIRPLGPVILMIAGITGLSVLAAHMVAEHNKLVRRRR